MAFVSLKNVKVAGISAGVPSNVVDNLKGDEMRSTQTIQELFDLVNSKLN